MMKMMKLSWLQRLTGGRIDLGLGMALMRDSRVPAKHKAAAVGVGVAVATGLVALELPLEALVAMALPVLGGVGDVIVDGAEEAIGTLVVASLVLPHIAPRHIVAEVRAEQ